MGFREGEAQGMAQMLIARRHQELLLRMRRETVTKGTEPSGAAIDHALKDMDERVRDAQRDPPPVDDGSGVLVNKLA
jgi:hypothetical protein